jgi:glycogen synthase
MQRTTAFESPLNVLVTGTSLFLRRHQHIFEALAPHFARVDYLPEPPFSQFDRAAYKLGSTFYRHAPRFVTSAVERLGAIHPYDARVFVARSLQLESQIARLPNAPDLILHVFGMYCPLWARPSIPYAMILDYTEALAYRNWREWAPFATERSLRCTCSPLEMERGDR